MATTNVSKVPIGTVLEGKFRITREIGRGGMAAVYEAENVDIGKRVAVKILAAELITSRVVRERFIREARAAASIRSPYICDVYDSGMFEDRPFLVMELLEGESLYDMMTRVRQIDAQTTLRIITHTARGLLKATESNIVHRDLKPENIFLTKDEEGHLLAKIVDFGLAKFYEPTAADAQTVRLTREGALFGTPAYMSPEQAKGQGEVDHRADLWALGCIVYECLTGQTVWNVEQGVAMILAQIASSPLPRPSKLRPDLPASFERWFERALDRDPEKRYQNAREFADSLAEALCPKEGDARAVSGGSDPGPSPDDTVLTPGGESRALFETGPDRVELGVSNGRDDDAAFKKSSGPSAISLLMVLAAVTLGGYATWLYVLHPPGKVEPQELKLASARPSAATRPKRAPKPLESATVSDIETESYAKKIAEAQLLLVTDPPSAIELLRGALKSGEMPVTRSLLSHAQVVVEEAGKCKVTGLARPRPFQIDVPVSRPAIAFTSKGVIAAWVDNHEDVRRRQLFTVVLDSAMRRISVPVSVTPEAQNVRQFQLVSSGDRIALLYWEDGGKEPGVYARSLDASGKIETSLRKLSSNRKADYYPALAAAPTGEFWAAWEEEFETNSSDVVVRRLGPDLEPKGKAVRLTALRPPPGPQRQPRTVSLEVDRTDLKIAWARDVGNQRLLVMLQSVPFDTPELASGLVELPHNAKRPAEDRFVGTAKPLSSPTGRNAQPHLACVEEGCYVAWDDEKAGAVTAFVDRSRGVLWHRQFATRGAGPQLARDEHGVVVAWYEGARLKFAPLTRDGVNTATASVISRVSGLQPSPEIVRGAKPGEWYVAFRDYESARLEAFAVRAECPE